MALAPLSLKAAPVEALKDAAYVPGDGHSRSLDLYLPKKKEAAPWPLIVWIHGGGWAEGDKAGAAPVSFTENGYAVASINYRLTNEAKFPAQIQDCKAAIRYLRSRAAEFGYDPERIGVAGDSAGGHLALLVGTSAGAAALEPSGAADATAPVQAVCDYYGPSDLSTIFQQMPAEGIQHPDKPGGLVYRLLGGLVKDLPESAKAASPVTYIDPKDPPVLIFHGAKDSLVPVAQSKEMKDALEAAGVKVTLTVVPGAGHGSNFPWEKINASMLEFFNSYLKPAK